MQLIVSTLRITYTRKVLIYFQVFIAIQILLQINFLTYVVVQKCPIRSLCGS